VHIKILHLTFTRNALLIGCAQVNVSTVIMNRYIIGLVLLIGVAIISSKADKDAPPKIDCPICKDCPSNSMKNICNSDFNCKRCESMHIKSCEACVMACGKRKKRNEKN